LLAAPCETLAMQRRVDDLSFAKIARDRLKIGRQRYVSQVNEVRCVE
jgi:hypothetical protein